MLGKFRGRRSAWTAGPLVLAVAACAGPAASLRGAHAFPATAAASLGVAEPQAGPPAGQTPIPPPAPTTTAPPSPAVEVGPPPTVEAAAAPPGEPEGEAPSRDPHRTRRDLGYIAIGIGAPAAVIAVVTSFMLLHSKGQRDDGCNAQKVCSNTGFQSLSAIDTTVPWNTASWIVGAVGLVGGTILVLTSQPRDAPASDNPSAPTTAITVSPAGAGATLGLRSTF